MLESMKGLVRRLRVGTSAVVLGIALGAGGALAIQGSTQLGEERLCDNNKCGEVCLDGICGGSCTTPGSFPGWQCNESGGQCSPSTPC